MRSYQRIQELICESTDILIPQGEINIPRNQMPQLAYKDYPEFFDHLNQRGISVTYKKIPVKNLRTSQRDINKEKVLSWSKSLPSGVKDNPIIISADFYCVDGHHRWLSQLNKDELSSIVVYQIGLPIMELLEVLKSFDNITYKTIDEEKVTWPKYDSFNSPFQIMRS